MTTAYLLDAAIILFSQKRIPSFSRAPGEHTYAKLSFRLCR
ncbi:hypothetical protein CPTD_01114 [Corynebacterium pseudotuberculosis]|nr:hypothetical protein CPTA_00432 [Corynebacterium pseudotuberculosis]AIG11053.1 hypothetical protein CPTC_00765 [Corynebacterium pseudotuberculosis]KEX89376.1 hypothetical protein CPTD_01114 [Corynebacterium pseudotuberculosis]